MTTLRFLATGAPYRTSLQWSFCVPHNSISILVREVCSALYDEYRAEALPLPSTPAQWKEVARGFSERWNFEHCLGAIDGKHVMIRKPAKSGTLNFNYKQFFSIVLMGVVDADYKFLWASVGAPGSASDGGIFKDSTLYRRIVNGTLGIPDPEPLPGQDRDVPYFFVGDDAFALAPWMMKPFPHRGQTVPQRLLNYRLSRARRIVENTFGILVNKWRCLTTTLLVTPATAKMVVKACLVLHQIIRMRRGPPRAGEVDEGDERNGAWRDARRLRGNHNMDGNRAAGRQYREAQATRNYLMDYYTSPEGAVPWQDQIVRRVVRRDPPQRVVAESPSESESDVD